MVANRVDPPAGIDRRPVVDGTVLSSSELRAQVRALQDGRDERIAAARDELARSLDDLARGLRALRSRLTERVRRAATVAGGAVAVAAGVAGAALWYARSGRRAESG